MKKIYGMFFPVVMIISGCASTAPTVESYSSFRIYQVSGDYSLTQVRDAVVSAAKSANENAAVVNGFPPSPLPAVPGRFSMKEIQMGPFSMQFPQMPGATVSIKSSKNPSSVESMNWVVGIYPYQGGYSVQMVMVAQYQRGFANPFNPVDLGASLGRELAYEHDGGIEGRIKHWFQELAGKIQKAVPMKLVEAYPSV